MVNFLIFAVALVGQPHKTEKPMALDPIKQRQVFEAWISANQWAESITEQLYPGRVWADLPQNERPLYLRKKAIARHNLSIGAANQICDAYKINVRTMEKVVRDPRSRLQKFVPEPIIRKGFNGVNSIREMTMPTKFDPQKVILPDKVADRIGYTNPSNEPEDASILNEYVPYMSNDYTPDGRRIPGAPHNPVAAQRRLDIKKRAEETIIKGPIPN